MTNETKQKEKAISVLDDYSVLVMDKEGLQQFFADGENLQKVGDRIESLARGLVADVTTKEGISQIKTAARQIASVKKKVDDIGKNVVASLKDLPKIIDNNRREFRERMEALQEEIRRPVTEIEEREKSIDDIKGTHFNCANMDSAALGDKIKELESAKASVRPEVWKESYGAAIKAYDGEIAALTTMKEAAEKREEDARKLAELEAKQAEADRIIREQKIREEAERKAREQAEAKAAAERARMQREKEEAELKAAEAEKRAQEAQEAARKAAQQQNAPTAPAATAQTPMSKTLPAAKPSAWTQEQKDINNAIVDAIAVILEDKLQGFTETGYKVAAKEIVKSIIKGRISNLKVVYNG